MPNTPHPLSNNAQAAFNYAKNIAQKNGQEEIDSLALLLALLQLPKSQALIVLQHLKVKVDNLVARVSATIKIEVQEAGSGSEKKRKELNLSAENESVLNESSLEMHNHGVTSIDEQILLLGMLRSPESKAGKILHQYGVTAEQVRESIKVIKQRPIVKEPIFALPKNLQRALRNGISPIFISLVLFTLAMAGFLWFEVGNNPKLFMFGFVIAGWMVSLCLHEFGHALVAFLCGDESVEDKGYLTINPLKYTHPLISVVIPVMLLLMGGFALPGGAVFINIYALRKPYYRSLVSAAGPLANVICLFLLALPFEGLMVYIFRNAPYEFLSALGFLALMQMSALFLNLLPLPGLDGFGILEPFLPRQWLEFANIIRPFTFMIIFLALWVDSPISDFFWSCIWLAIDLISFNLGFFANEGLWILFG